MDIKERLATIICKFFNKKIKSRTTATSKIRKHINGVLAQELHKPVNKKFKRRKMYLRFEDNVSAADLAEIGLLSSKNEGVKHEFHIFFQQTCLD